MNKRKIITTLIVLAFGIFTGFFVTNTVLKNKNDINNERTFNQRSSMGLGVDELLDASDKVVEAIVQKKLRYKEYDLLTISVVRNLKGNYEKTIEIRNYEINDEYLVGEKYLFLIQLIDNVYETKNIIMNDTFYPMTTDDKSINDIIKYAEDYSYPIMGNGASLSVPYYKDVDDLFIVKNSQYLVQVQILDSVYTNDSSVIYYAHVKEDYNSNINTDEDGCILVPLFKKCECSKGDCIVVGLNSDVSDSILYSLSSKNAIYRDVDYVERLLEGR